MMSERHTTANIADRLSEIIKEWDIKVFCTVHNNASNMNLAMELCEKFPKDLGCNGQTLQLAIKSGLVSHFRHSALVTCALKKWQEQLGIRANKLQNDCPVRWNSTVVMLQRLFDQRIAVQSLLKRSPNQVSMKASQWELVEQLIPLLQPLAKATEIMCGELHVGLSFIYPVIFNMIKTTLRVQASDLAAVRNFKITVCEQLEKRFKLESDWPGGNHPYRGLCA